MNVESILSKIQLFEELVIDSGFRRDVADFVKAIQQSQNQNLVFMKGLSQKIQLSLTNFENNSLHTELQHVLRNNDPFTSHNIVDALKELDADDEIDGSQYFQKMNSILSQLLSSIDQNKSEILPIKDVFSKYISDKTDFQTAEEQALVSLVFKDLKSTSGLKEFSRVLSRWNTTLLILHQLMKSESPEEISLVEIQNGSIDVIFNIDVNIAIDLTEIAKTGLEVFAAYLLYKSSKEIKEIVEASFGSKELIKIEQDREKLMLARVKEAIKEKIAELHNEHLTSDKKIDKTAIDGKIDAVSTAITDHIIRGNEIKVLALPKPDEDEGAEEEDENQKDLSNELRKSTAIVRERAKKLSSKDQQLLLEIYAIDEDD